MDAITYERRILNVECAECAAPVGTPCVAIQSGRYHRKGNAIAGYHAKRVLKAHPEHLHRVDSGKAVT